MVSLQLNYLIRKLFLYLRTIINKIYNLILYLHFFFLWNIELLNYLIYQNLYEINSNYQLNIHKPNFYF